MNFYIVRVSIVLLDGNGIENGSVAVTYAPVKATDDTEACKRAVLWHGDNGIAVEDEDLQWKCDDTLRGLSFKATRCLAITAEEMDVFLSLTAGVSTANIIGSSKAVD